MKKEDIIYKALKNPKFKKALEENPKKALEKEFGEKLSDDINVKIIQEKPNEIILILPNISKDHSINDKNLQKIAGGTLTESSSASNWS